MGRQENGKKGGGKLARSETVTVRLDPKLRYLAELAARKQRRTLSSFIEWAIEQSLDDVPIHDAKKGELTNLTCVSGGLWDVGSAERFLKLALKCPELLNYKEQRMWKFIDEWGAMWDVVENNRRYFRVDLLNSLWAEFEQYGNEEITVNELVTKVEAYLSRSGGPFNPTVTYPQPRYIDQEI
jgi:hypothetical protein